MVKLLVLVLEAEQGMGDMGISMRSRGCRVVMGIRLCDELGFGYGIRDWEVERLSFL